METINNIKVIEIGIKELLDFLKIKSKFAIIKNIELKNSGIIEIVIENL